MIRRATVHDMQKIHAIINRFADEGRMLPMSIGQITARLRDFSVAEVDGEVVGTVAVHVTWENLVELRSLAVAPTAQGTGLGQELVKTALADAAALAAGKIFTLTYIPEFFERFDFVRIDRAELPHKVWQDCTNCPKFPDCGEIALIREV